MKNSSEPYRPVNSMHLRMCLIEGPEGKDWIWAATFKNLTFSAAKGLSGKPFKTKEDAKDDFKEFAKAQCITWETI